MKRYGKFVTALAVFFMIGGPFGVPVAQADELLADDLTETIAECVEETQEEQETEEREEPARETEEEPEKKPEVVTAEAVTETLTGAEDEEELTEKAESVAKKTLEPEEGSPAFLANVEWSQQGWIVKGVFQDLTPDIVLIQPMCSTDGENYRDCGQAWDLNGSSSGDEAVLEKLRSQRCLFDSEEPFKSYLAKERDRFFIKLRVVREGGMTVETQAAAIERKEQQTEPEEVIVTARFAPCMFVREGRPPKMQCYGRYQITVREDACAEEIAALLPETLPVEVQFQRGDDYIGNDIVDCPVRWKALELLQLAAGESVTLPDAAEEIVVPAGTVLHTQTGVYQTNDPVALDQDKIMTDEVRLVLNVVAKDGQPEGMLAAQNHGLEVAFRLKPTGVEEIRTYYLREGDTAWTEIAGLSLISMVDAQPSTANSGYAVVLDKEKEPYLSYRRAEEAGEEPAPIYVGLKFEGGVYDGRQLVLAWPDTYELPLDLPEVGGSGGNEGNAGSDDKDDSTESGQRPGLSEEEPDTPPPGESEEEPGTRPPGESKEESDTRPSGESKGEPDTRSSGSAKEEPDPMPSEPPKEGTDTPYSGEAESDTQSARLPKERTDNRPVGGMSEESKERTEEEPDHTKTGEQELSDSLNAERDKEPGAKRTGSSGQSDAGSSENLREATTDTEGAVVVQAKADAGGETARLFLLVVIMAALAAGAACRGAAARQITDGRRKK